MEPERRLDSPSEAKLVIGVDVGSTTVKCVVLDPATEELLWSRYERHETRQAEKTAEMLESIGTAFPDIPYFQMRAFITGSGAGPIAEHIGARFVQEVNAVAIAVENKHPDVRSVVELGGQDAKIVLFKENEETGERQIVTSMNDKCASGTGATIDKCMLKVGMKQGDVSALQFEPGKLHHVAARCGVFAETDIVNLVKAGVPAGEIMNSLADAIVMQNLTVLTRGNTLRDRILLLGGPNTFLPFLREAWRLRITETWEERDYKPAESPIEELVYAPDDAQYYAATGAALFGMQEPGDDGVYLGLNALQSFISHGRKASLGTGSGPPLLANGESYDSFAETYQIPPFQPAKLKPGVEVRGYVGFDGGSTTSKAVLIDEDGDVLTKEYILSDGNPVKDAKDILASINAFATDQGCRLNILGFGATGYAADVLDSAMAVDANIVETVAHMLSAKQYFGEDVDVICDIGGQDIKVLFLQNGAIKSFKLSTQCSAGNGMLLQAMADQFGVDVRDFADHAFQADLSPKFNCGCAVFLDADRVNFQKEGYSKEELFAGLAQVLPKNVWQHVVQVPRLSEFGRKFVLQGGTQRNLAALKAQVDYIRHRVPDAQVVVHPHCGEAGAIGAALEARRVVQRRKETSFIGLQDAIDLQYTTRTDESTRCHFCANNCLRTFIDTQTPDGRTARYIAGFSCEKGTVESKEAVIKLNQERKRLKEKYPNLVDYEASLAFRRFYKPEPFPEQGVLIEDVDVRRSFFGYGPVKRKHVQRAFQRSSPDAEARRKELRFGIPRALNNYTLAPFLRTYLETLGIPHGNIVFSDETTEDLYLEGGKYGSIDPCYPSKVSLAHVYNLLVHKHRRKPLSYIWFPTFTHVPTFVSNTLGSTACPVAAGTPSVAKAAFIKEKDHFAEAGISYVFDALNFENAFQLRQQLFETWGEQLGITSDENDWACEQGWAAMRLCDEELQRRGLDLLTQAEQNNDIVLLLLARPYHNDPGLNHQILEEFQALGYPALSIRSVPKDAGFLGRFYQKDLSENRIKDVFDVNDVWAENYSANSVQKVWAAKFAARHPNVAVLDLSSFKCGHDAPTYGLIDKIIASGKTPSLALHDLDANKPGGSIKIRVKTYAYTLGLYKEGLEDNAAKQDELERRVAAMRAELLAEYRMGLEQKLADSSENTQRGLAAAFNAYLEKDTVDLKGGRHDI